MTENGTSDEERTGLSMDGCGPVEGAAAPAVCGERRARCPLRWQKCTTGVPLAWDAARDSEVVVALRWPLAEMMVRVVTLRGQKYTRGVSTLRGRKCARGVRTATSKHPRCAGGDVRRACREDGGAWLSTLRCASHARGARQNDRRGHEGERRHDPAALAETTASAMSAALAEMHDWRPDRSARRARQNDRN